MVVVIIAAFPVLASMIMLVKNKSKDIAILRTIGATVTVFYEFSLCAAQWSEPWGPLQASY